LTPHPRIADNSRRVEAPRVDTLQAEIARLSAEVAKLREAQKRLVLASDADRSRLERALHEGVQQRLVALAVSVQLAEASSEEMERELQDALAESALLAQRIYPALLDAGGLAAALRAVATGTSASVNVAAGLDCGPHLARTIYWCWLETLERADGARATITVGLEDDAVTFDIVGRSASGALDGLRKRARALGGELTVEADARGETHLHGWLPLGR
jgi:signal transduction histidine kinase